MASNSTYRVSADVLREFCTTIFVELGVPDDDAWITADVLIEADLRGVVSHGVARLRRYVNGLRDGVMAPRPDIRTTAETPATAAFDAGGGLGQPVSHRAMSSAIEKAGNVGVGIVTVRNSNHYGIAGYYAMMALEEDMIGCSMTNTAVLVVPTFPGVNWKYMTAWKSRCRSVGPRTSMGSPQILRVRYYAISWHAPAVVCCRWEARANCTGDTKAMVSP